MKQSILVGTSVALFVALTAAGPARAERPFPGTLNLYDSTDRMGRNMRLDWDFIHGLKDTGPSGRRLVGAASTEVRRNYVYIQDNDGTLPAAPFRSENDLYDAFNFAAAQLYMVEPNEFKFIYLFTSFETGVGAFFYSPLINVDRGIGQSTFDQKNSASDPLEGFVFMNYWQSFEQEFGQGGPTLVQNQSRFVFNQEAGHRWGVQFMAGPGINDGVLQGLLGRMMGHWSYFMNSQGSPMEGNWWADNGNGSFTTQTGYDNWYYNPIDLYFMGLQTAEMIPPWFSIDNPQVGNARDLTGQVVNLASPPQIFQPVTVRGTRHDFTYHDLVDRLGPRDPPVGLAPTSWRSVFVLLANQANPFDESTKQQFETMVEAYGQGFSAGAKGLGHLDYQLMASMPKLPIGGVCTNANDCNTAESNLCLAAAQGAQSFCTRGCTSGASCPMGWCCQMDNAGNQNICTPTDQCQVSMPDAGVAPDAGMSSAPDAAQMQEVCACDTHVGCDQDCACDNDCYASDNCACDMTTGCDPNCSCDPECAGGAAPAHKGCTCVDANADQQARASGLIGIGLALLWIARRRTLASSRGHQDQRSLAQN